MSQSKIMMGIGMPISQRSMPRTEPFLYLHHSNRDNNVRRSCEVPSSSDFTRSKAATKLVVLYGKTPFFCPTPGKDRWWADNHQRAATSHVLGTLTRSTSTRHIDAGHCVFGTTEEMESS